MDILRSVAPAGSPLSVGSPLVWFIFVACAVLQLPLIMDFCSQLFGVNRLVHSVVSKILVTLMTICGCLSIYLYHMVFLPQWQQATASPDRVSPALVGLTVFTTWLFLNSSYRFSRAIMTDPGDGYAAKPVAAEHGKHHPDNQQQEEGHNATTLRTCKKCDMTKAPFAHHCSVWCGRGPNYRFVVSEYLQCHLLGTHPKQMSLRFRPSIYVLICMLQRAVRVLYGPPLPFHAQLRRARQFCPLLPLSAMDYDWRRPRELSLAPGLSQLRAVRLLSSSAHLTHVQRHCPFLNAWQWQRVLHCEFCGAVLMSTRFVLVDLLQDGRS